MNDETIARDPLLRRRPYFFDAGIRFACQNCGVCCTGAPGTIYVGPDDIQAIAAYLGRQTDQLVADSLYPFRDSYSIREDADGNCLFYKNGCTIYEVRPVQCRTYPFWLSTLRSEAAWHRTRRQCPGIGKGHLYSRDQILERINAELTGQPARCSHRRRP